MIVMRYSYVLIITWTVCKCIMVSALLPPGASRNSLGRIQSWRNGMEKKLGLFKVPPENPQYHNVLKLSNKGHNHFEKSFNMQTHPPESSFARTVSAGYKSVPRNMYFNRYGVLNNLRNASKAHPISYLKDSVSSPRLHAKVIHDLQRNLPQLHDLQRNLPQLIHHIKNNVSDKQYVSNYQGNYIPKMGFKNLKETGKVKALSGSAFISPTARDMLQMYRLTTEKQWKPAFREGPDISEGKVEHDQHTIEAIHNLLRLLPEISKYKGNDQRYDKDSKIVGKNLQDRLKAVAGSRNISGSTALHPKLDNKLSMYTALGGGAKGRDKELLKKNGQHYEMVQKMQGLLKFMPKNSYDDVVKKIYSDRYNMYSQLEKDLENNHNYNYDTEKSTKGVTTSTEENQDFSSSMPYQVLQHQADQLENLSIPDLRTEDIEEALQPVLGTLSVILEDSLNNVSEKDYGDQYFNYNDSDPTLNTETVPTLELEELAFDLGNPSNRLAEMIDTTEPCVQNASNIYSAVSEILSKAKQNMGDINNLENLENATEVLEITPKNTLFNANVNGGGIRVSNNPHWISEKPRPTTRKVGDENLFNRTESTDNSTINISNQMCLQNAYDRKNVWTPRNGQMETCDQDDDVITVTTYISFDPTPEPCQLSQLMSESLRSANNTCVILEIMRELLNIIIEKYHCDEDGLEYENTDITTNGMDYDNFPVYMLSYPDINRIKAQGADKLTGYNNPNLPVKMEHNRTYSDVAKYINDMLSELDKNLNTSPAEEKYVGTEDPKIKTASEMNLNSSEYHDTSNVLYNQEEIMKQSKKLGHIKSNKDQCYTTLQTMEGLLKKLPDKSYYNVAKELQNELNYTFSKMQTDKYRPTPTEEVEYSTINPENHEILMTNVGGIPIILESRKLPAKEEMVDDQNHLKDNLIQARKYEANPIKHGEYNQDFRKAPMKYLGDSWQMDGNPAHLSNTKNKALGKHMKYGGLPDILAYTPGKSLAIEVSQETPRIYTLSTGAYYDKGEGDTDDRIIESFTSPPDLPAVTLDMIQTVPGIFEPDIKNSTFNVIPINYTYNFRDDPLNYVTVRTKIPEEISELPTYKPESVSPSYPILRGKNGLDMKEEDLKYMWPLFSRDFLKGKLNEISGSHASQPVHQVLNNIKYGGRERIYEKLDQEKGASPNNTIGHYNYNSAQRLPQKNATDDIEILKQLLALQKLRSNASFKENRTEANYSNGTQNINSTENFNTTTDVGIQTETTEVSKSREALDDEGYDMMQKKHGMAQPLFEDEFKRESERIFNDRYRMYNYLKKHSARRLGLKELLLW